MSPHDQRTVDVVGAAGRGIIAPATDAKLSDSQLSGADVRDADFGTTDFRDATGTPNRASAAQYSDTICPDGSVQSSSCWP